MNSEYDQILKFYSVFLSQNQKLISENIFLSSQIPSFDSKILKSWIRNNSNGLISNLAPLIADCLKRSVRLNNILDVFLEYQDMKKKYNKEDLQLQRISSRNLIEFFLQVSPLKIRSLIGSCLARNLETFVPLSYWKYGFEINSLHYHIDISTILNLIDELNERKIILNFGLDENVGKTSLLSTLFEIKTAVLNINKPKKEILVREATVDLYLNYEYAIIDINGFEEEIPKFRNFFIQLCDICDGFLLHTVF